MFYNKLIFRFFLEEKEKCTLHRKLCDTLREVVCFFFPSRKCSQNPYVAAGSRTRPIWSV